LRDVMSVEIAPVARTIPFAPNTGKRTVLNVRSWSCTTRVSSLSMGRRLENTWLSAVRSCSASSTGKSSASVFPSTRSRLQPVAISAARLKRV
jgi:hypothetical protein